MEIEDLIYGVMRIDQGGMGTTYGGYVRGGVATVYVSLSMNQSMYASKIVREWNEMKRNT